MGLKRGKFLLAFLVSFLLIVNFAYAFNVETKNVVETIINDGGHPAIINFDITSTGESGNFKITTTERFDLINNEFSITNGQTLSFDVEFSPTGIMKTNKGYIKIPYSIQNENSLSAKKGEIVIKLVDFDEAIVVKGESVNFDSEKVIVKVYNVEDISFDNIKADFSSVFFDDFSEDFSLAPYESKLFEVDVNVNRLKKLVFGDYAINAVMVVDGRKNNFHGTVNLIERSGIGTKEYKEGAIIRSTTVEKKNEGNVPTIAEIRLEKNIISRLFTSFSEEPNRVERNGFKIFYYWQKELQPDETLNVKITTNLLIPFILIIAIIAIAFLFNVAYSRDVLVKKHVNFVKTKGGEFALKVTLRVSSNKFVENVKIYDSLPAIAHLYEKYGKNPDSFDKNSKRISWNVGKLGQGEERVYTYIIYSKLRVLGRFELPKATCVYSKNGANHESQSNRVIFIHEPIESKEE